MMAFMRRAHNVISKDEYRTVRSGVGLVPRFDTQFLRLEGKDALDLFNRISTNELKEFRNGEIRSTILVTDKARIIDFITLIQHDDFFLLEVSTVDKNKVKAWIDKYIITEEVKVLEPTTYFAKYSLMGQQVNSFIRQLGVSCNDRYHDNIQAIAIDRMEIIVTRDPLFSSEVWNLYLSVDRKDEFESNLLSTSKYNVQKISEEVFEIFRIEEGGPRVGKELTEQVNPPEAGLERYVSFTKGCYLGQEVIARLDTYKKLQRKLVGFILSSEIIEEGCIIFQEGINVGWITSICYSPMIEKRIGLGYLKTNISANNLKIMDQSSAEHAITLVGLPFSLNFSDYLPSTIQ